MVVEKGQSGDGGKRQHWLFELSTYIVIIIVVVAAAYLTSQKRIQVNMYIYACTAVNVDSEPLCDTGNKRNRFIYLLLPRTIPTSSPNQLLTWLALDVAISTPGG